MKKLVLIPLATFVLVAATSAQMGGGKKPASPPASAQCTFSDGKSIKIDYSSPRAKGRKIFGTGDALVPYGEVWRTGANDATTFVTSANLNVGGKDVPAGNYTIFTVPNADQWMLIINKKTGEWGIPYKYESDELGRVPMAVSKTSGLVENFTIAFDQAGSKCTLRMEWENTRATVDISEK